MQSATAKIRRGKKLKEKRRNHRTKYNVHICYAGRPQWQHMLWSSNITTKLFSEMTQLRDAYVCMTAGSMQSSSKRRRMWWARARLTIGLALAISWSQKSSHDSHDTRWRLPAKLCQSSNKLDESSLQRQHSASSISASRVSGSSDISNTGVTYVHYRQSMWLIRTSKEV